MKPQLPPNPSAGDVLRHSLADSVERLMEHDPDLRIGSDPECVHQARVATRRLRSVLRTFEPFFDDGWAAELRSELGGLAAVLGDVRDADVRRERLTARIHHISGPDERLGASLVAALERARIEAAGELRSLLDSEGYSRLLGRLAEAVTATPFMAEAWAPADSLLPPVRRAWTKFRSRVRAAHDPATDADLHKIRIRAKRLRYATETVEPFVGKPARRTLARLEEIQTALGDHNDAVVTLHWLRDWGERSLDPGAAFVAGEVGGLELADAARSRTTWEKSYERLARKGARAWM